MKKKNYYWKVMLNPRWKSMKGKITYYGARQIIKGNLKIGIEGKKKSLKFNWILRNKIGKNFWFKSVKVALIVNYFRKKGNVKGWGNFYYGIGNVKIKRKNG